MPATEEERQKEEADTQSNCFVSDQEDLQGSSGDDSFAEPYEDVVEDEQKEIFLQDEPPVEPWKIEDEDTDEQGSQETANAPQSGKKAERSPKVWSSVLYRFLVNRKIDGDFLIDRDHTEQ